jgi:hypothetical protein
LRSQAGQAVVLMAMMMVAIIGAAGIAIDAGIGHYYNHAAEKAAAAAALAGVVFMPYDYAGAQVRAREEARRNGFDEADASADVRITVERVPGSPNRLKVTVSRKVPVFFMAIFGVSSYRVGQSARASYLPPISLGQPGNQIGATAAQLGSEGHEFVMVMQGWKTDRENGDPFTPDPRFDRGMYEPSDDLHWISREAGNEVLDDSLPARGGYNFQVSLPYGGHIEVYNAVHGPDGNNRSPHNYCNNARADVRQCNPRGGNYYFHEEYFMGIDDSGSRWEPGTDPEKYLTMQYTVFQVRNLFNHTADTRLSQVRVHPVDATDWAAPDRQYKDVRNGALITQAYNGLGNPTNMNVYHSWVNIADPDNAPVVETVQRRPGELPPGTYRLRVDALDYDGTPLRNGAGFKAFGVRGVGTAVQVSGWNDMTIFTPFNGAQFEMPIFQLPPEYRGQEISIEIFDPGDILGVGDVSMSVISPSGTVGQAADGIYHLGVQRSVEDTSALRTVCNSCPATFVSTQAGNRLYNGDWIRIELKVPLDYCQTEPCASDPNRWWWKIRYTTGGAQANDTLSLAVYLKGKGNPARQLN